MIINEKMFEKFQGKSITPLFLLFLLCSPARAVVIEGFTPTGKFRALQVADNGILGVANSTTSTTFVTIGQSTFVPVATASTFQTGQVNISSGSATVLFASSNTAIGTAVCNQSATNTPIWVGGVSVSTSTGLQLIQNQCLVPDTPAAFQASLSAIAISTQAVAGFWREFYP